MLVLHGILGSGANFRTFARRLAIARPAWGFALVDLRLHGASSAAPPPHSLAAAARDLLTIVPKLPGPLGGLMGHSFGGKVALAFASVADQPLGPVWIIDSSPSRRDEDALGAALVDDVVAMLRRLPAPLPSRERFVELVLEHGFTPAIAEWLAMNVRRTPDGFRLRLDLDGIGALLEDYHATDLWPALASPRPGTSFHFVAGGHSDVLSSSDRARLASFASRLGSVSLHVIEGAGHWVHVDAPDELFSLVSASL